MANGDCDHEGHDHWQVFAQVELGVTSGIHLEVQTLATFAPVHVKEPQADDQHRSSCDMQLTCEPIEQNI